MLKTSSSFKMRTQPTSLPTNSNLLNFSTFEDGRNFVLTRCLLSINTKTLSPVMTLTNQFFTNSLNLNIAASAYGLTQDNLTKPLLSNNDLFFFKEDSHHCALLLSSKDNPLTLANTTGNTKLLCNSDLIQLLNVTATTTPYQATQPLNKQTSTFFNFN
jgi:hypothetical protein